MPPPMPPLDRSSSFVLRRDGSISMRLSTSEPLLSMRKMINTKKVVLCLRYLHVVYRYKL
jgi:hypothetical protein